MDTPTEKRCGTCRQIKPLDSFCKDNYGRYGRHSKCRDCMKAAQAIYRSENRDTLLAKKREKYATDETYRNAIRATASRWRQQNPERAQANQMRTRERNRAVCPTFTSAEWLALCEEFGNRCCACGGEGPLTMDHVIPQSMGGDSAITNFQPLCLSCNSSKQGRMIDFRPLAKARLEAKS